jgi:hypothetical protein
MILIKGYNNELPHLHDNLIGKTKIAFVKNRFIMEGVVILHEVKREKMSESFSKLILQRLMIMYISFFYKIRF